METWIEQKDIKSFSQYFKEFNLYWKTATRENTYGRAKGGILVGVREDVKEFVKVEDNDLFFDISIRTSKDFTHLVPVYLNCGSWISDFEDLCEFVNRKYSDKLILIGDFNARTGNEQYLDDDSSPSILNLQEKRESQDKTINSNGKKIIDFFNDMSLAILNGRVEGDRCGKITFDGCMGKSVIDYCAASQSVLKEIKTFEVGRYLHSDHFPLMISLQINSHKNIESSKLLPKIKFITSKKDIYSDKIKCVIDNWKSTDNDLGNVTAELLVSELRSIGESVLRNGNCRYKHKWYDKECEEARKLSFKIFNLLRENSGSEFYRVLYGQLNKTYKQLCDDGWGTT